MTEYIPRAMPKLWDRFELARAIAAWREEGSIERVVLANGCFDLLHVGHVRYLEEAATHGDFLVVALNTDRSVRDLKGEGKPLTSLEERAEILCALKCVGATTSFDEATLEETLRALVPDVHTKGTDYTEETVPERGVDHELGIVIKICGDPKDHSSSEIARRC